MRTAKRIRGVKSLMREIEPDHFSVIYTIEAFQRGVQMAFVATGGVDGMYWLDSLANHYGLGEAKACFVLCFASTHFLPALAITKARISVTLDESLGSHGAVLSVTTHATTRLGPSQDSRKMKPGIHIISSKRHERLKLHSERIYAVASRKPG